MIPKRTIPPGKECLHLLCGAKCRRTDEAKPKKVYQLKRTPLKKVYQPKEVDDELEKFFYDCYCIIESSPTCAECGEWIPRQFYRHAVAHLFPKKIFKSISTHPLNWMKYGAGCSCHEATHRMDTFSKMRTFPIAVEKFRQFEHLITEKHSYLDLFKQYANQISKP